jgi:5-hydroxyisourate hydrolase-like protein (transthyretin family)
VTDQERILDANLEQLLRRSYVPALPRPELRRALLALAREEAEQRGARPRRLALILVPMALAAAGVLAWLGLRAFGAAPETGASPRAGSAALVAQDGTVLPPEGATGGPESAVELSPREARGPELASPEGPADAEKRAALAPESQGAAAAVGEVVAESEHATLLLSVRDAAGAPLQRYRALILLDRDVPDVDEPLWRDVDDAEGALRWEGIAPDRYEVFVEVAGHAGFRSGVLELSAGEPLELEVELQRGRTLRGFVLDAPTQAPVPGALVMVETELPCKVLPMEFEEPPGWLRRFVRSDASGAFEIADVAPGRQRLRISSAEHAAQWRTLEVPADGPLQPIDVRLDAGGRLAGSVTDAAGLPVEGALVLATFADDPAQSRAFSYSQTLTDAEGRFAFAHLAAGFYMIVMWESVELAKSGAPPRLRPAMVAAGKESKLDLRGDGDGIRLSGRILDAQGAPAAELKFSLLPSEASNTWAPEAWEASNTDAAGAYAVTVRKPGTYLLFATLGMGERLTRVAAFEVPVGAQSFQHDVHLSPAAVECRLVRAADGAPVERALGVLLLLGGAGTDFAGRALSDSAGRFSFESVPPGRYIIAASPVDTTLALAQAVSEPFDVLEKVGASAPATLAFELRLAAGGALRVRVEDATGAPLADAAIRVLRPDGSEQESFSDFATDADGALLVPGLAPGSYRIVAELAGHEPASGTVQVQEEAVVSLTLRLPPAAK